MEMRNFEDALLQRFFGAASVGNIHEQTIPENIAIGL